MHVLLIDHDPRVAEIARRACAVLPQSPQLWVLGAGDEPARHLFHRGGDPASPLPALIVSDLSAPGTDGAELLARAKRDPRLQTVPFVVMTASREAEDLNRSYLAGANSYILKPDSDEELEATLRQLLRYWLDVNEPPPAAVGGAVPSRGGGQGRPPA
jgi:CheY-like chemotaxis protein